MADLKPPLRVYSIDLLPAPPEQKLLQELIDRLARKQQTNRFEVHLTLLPLPDLDEENERRVSNCIRQLAQESVPFLRGHLKKRFFLNQALLRYHRWVLTL